MSTYGFARMLTPRGVAVVGAGERDGSVGRAVCESLAAGGFPGPVWRVNPNYDTIDGERAYPSLSDLPEPPDLVLVATPPAAVPDIVAAAGVRGAAAAVILSTRLGSDERAPIGAARRIARERSLRLLGPDSVGLAVPGARLNATLLAHPPLPGDLALVSQSGTVASAIAAWAHRRGLGFSAVLTLGNSVEVDVADALDHFAADLHTRAILLSLHGIADARKFLSAARAAARVKPVVVLRTGRHEAPLQAARTHTGALARSHAVYEAAFRRAGLLAVDSLDAMFSAAETLRRQRPFPGGRLMILANGRGLGALAADRLDEAGGRLAEPPPELIAKIDPLRHPGAANPIDLGVDAGAETFGAAIPPLLADRSSDALLCIHVPTARAGSRAAAERITQEVGTARRSGRKKPVFAVCVGEDEGVADLYDKAAIPLFGTDAEAVDGFLHLVRYREAQDDLMRTPDALPGDFRPDVESARNVVARALEAGQSWLDPLGVEALLTAYGIPLVPTRLAPDGGAAAEAAWPLLAEGRPVALKLVSPDVVHKSDVGGVRLGLTSEADIREAAERMVRRVRERAPEARVTGFAVQAMAPRGARRELIAGLAEDPVFGPVVVFGAGGTAVEVVDDRALGLPPLDLRLADDLIGRTRISKRLAAYRDVAAADRAAIAGVLVRLAQLAADLPEVRELDINPLLADADGVLAVDGRVRVAPETAAEGGAPPTTWHPRFAIRPYPVAWERTMSLKGRAIRVRPVRPEDEAMFGAFFASVDPEDVRLRFFSPMRQFSHAFLARLTQLDYARAIAFVALDPGETDLGRRMLGAVRLHADANHESGEFAILVRSDIKGFGLGYALMRMMIEWAQAEGIGRIEGEVLAENRAMLAVCRRLGFRVKAARDDPNVVNVTLGATSDE